MVAGRDQALAQSMLQARQLLQTWERIGRAHVMVGGACSCGIGGVIVALEDRLDVMGPMIHEFLDRKLVRN